MARLKIETPHGAGDAVRALLRAAHWLGAPTAATAVLNSSERLGTARADLVPGCTVVAVEQPPEEPAFHKRLAELTNLVEELAEECDQRADADCTGDPPRYVPNFAMELLTKIRAVVPR